MVGTVACLPECPDTMTCEAGECVCLEGSRLCNDVCISVREDPDNCGACGKKCADGCSEGRCFTNVAKNDNPVQMALNATHVYFTAAYEGILARVPRGGGSVQPLADTMVNPGMVALDGTSVYWLIEGNVDGGGAVAKMPLQGGAVVRLAEDDAAPTCIALDATNVYWSSYPDGPIWKVPKAGGAKVEVASGAVTMLPMNVSVDDEAIYWTSTSDGGSIHKRALAGGAISALAKNLPSVFNFGELTRVGDTLYFGYHPAGGDWEVAKMSTSGGSVTSLLNVLPLTIVGDETGLYMSTVFGGPHRLLKVSLDGATQAVLASDVNVTSLYVDGDDLFWANQNGHIRSTSTTP